MSIILYVFVLISLLISIYWISNRKEKNIVENIVFSIAILILSNLICSILIASIFPLFSLEVLSIMLMVETGILFLVIKKNKLKSPIFKVHMKRWEFLVLLIFLFFGVIYLCYPIEYFDGGRDPGLYYLGAIRIADSGGWLLDYDSVLNEVYSQYNEFLRRDGYPGLYLAYVYGLDNEYGYLIPQFLPGASSLFAIAFALGGYFLLNRINGFIALLTLCLLYITVKKGFKSRYVALLTIVFLGLSPAYIWNSRETTTEILMFFLIMLAAYLENDEEENLWKYALEGLVLGLANIVRTDACILSIALVLKEIVDTIIIIKDRRKSIVRVVSYSLVTCVCVCYSYVFSYPYFKGHERFLIPAYVGFGVLLFVYFIVLYISKFLDFTQISSNIHRLFQRKSILLLVSFLLLILFKIVYFLRPTVEGAGFSEKSLVEFSWYTSAIAVVMAILGVVFAMYHFEVLKRNLLLFAIGFGYFVVYIYKPAITSDHMWASRRWVSAAIPIIFICASYALVNIAKRQRIISVIVSTFIVGYLFYQDAPFLFNTMMKDLHVSYEEYASILEDDKIYFTTNGYIASYLTYVYDKHVYIVSNRDKMEEYVKQNGEVIYYIGSEGNETVNYECIGENSISYQTLENSFGRMPRELNEVFHATNLYVVTPN